jgi:hypothetical protein
MMVAWWIWGVALVLYSLFVLWYHNWRGPLTPAEIDVFLVQSAKLPVSGNTDRSVLRAFLEADDGRDFLMSNLVRIHPGDVVHPITGLPVSGQALFQQYGWTFVKLLLKHGGHPMMAMRKVGGYVDAWNTPDDPGWHIVGLMRYRSRRDMMALAIDPRMRGMHILKSVSTSQTFSFPSQPLVSLALLPRVSVALVLALLAALLHLTILLGRSNPGLS